MNEMTPEKLASMIDHTLLRPDAQSADIERLCAEAVQFKFKAVCIPGSRVVEAVHFLGDSGVKLVTVAGFPTGADDPDVKRFEAEVAADNGADEIDMVMNIGWLKDGRKEEIVREIRDVIEAADGRTVKVILETGYLTDEEKSLACLLALEAEAHFVKTSTGFGPGGATVDDVELLRRLVGRNCGVKASGGIRTLESALAMVEAGASRLGCSNSVAIMRGFGIQPAIEAPSVEEEEH